MYQISVFIHVIAAMFWIGGMLFTVGVLVPASRDTLLKDKRGAFFTLIGKKFSRISWLLFGLLILTGITNLLARGISWEFILEPAFWQYGMGATLFIKLCLFGMVLIISGIHDFYAGPKAAALMDESPSDKITLKMRKFTSWLGRVNLILGLGILFFALKLLRS